MENLLIPLIVMLGICGIIIFFFERKKISEVRNNLSEKHFEHIFGDKGNFIAFNLKSNSFVRGNFFTKKSFEYEVIDIIDFQWKWVEHNAIKTDNKFIFHISDVNYPLHEIFYKNERKAETEWAKLQAVYEQCKYSQENNIHSVSKVDKYDFFISHASEDKDNFVRPLYHELTALGLSVWYDEFMLEAGDSLRRSIDKGLANSKYGIVVLSPSFFAAEWAEYELDALVNKSAKGTKFILPIWHNLSRGEVENYSFSLADKIALDSSSESIEIIAHKLLSITKKT